MAEILSYGVNLIMKDNATSNGNTILGSAVPTDSATEGVQKEAGQTGIFVYTDKSFTVYFHHGSQWVEYMSVDVTDADWTGSVNIPWAAHDTHGAVDTMYFKTDEASHEMRLVTFTTPIFVDATPGDSDLTYDGLIIDIDGASENVDETLYGSETEFVRFEKLDASSYTEGETIIFTKSGKYNNSYVVIDGVDIPSTEIYTGDPSYSTQISFVVPNGITPTSVVDIFFDQEYVYIPTYPNTHSVEFDGINDFVRIGAPITHYGDKTISMWIKPASITTDDNLVSCWKDPGGGTPLATVRFTATGLGAYSGTNNTQPITSVLPAVDTWSHICVVWEGTSSNGGGTITGYVNGGGAINMPVTQNPQGGQASAWFTTNHPDLSGGLGLGAKLLSVWGNHFHGKMDEVACFDAALDATQVASLYNSGTPDANNILALSPVAWWRMGEGDTYPTITNQVAGGLDALMTNMDGDEIVEDTP